MNNMEIQREAVIEIVGTQYEERALNHRSLFLQQELVLKHQSDNPHDHNAVILLTKNEKELGYLPKGYASLYAPAIDSGRYNFSVEIVKAEFDPESPILIVKITSEPTSRSEEEIESEIIGFVQNIVNGYALRTKEYLTFIYSEAVNVDELLSALDKARLIQKLISCSNIFIESHGIKPNSDKYAPLTKDSLTDHLSELKADISDVLKQIKEIYDNSYYIDDEEEYHRVQSEIRERRKRFRQYDDLLASLLEAVTSYNSIAAQANSPISVDCDSESKKQIPETKIPSAVSEPDATEFVSTEITKPEPEISTPDIPQLTEPAFFEWLVSEGGVSESTAKQYISYIHSIEKLYQTLFGVRKNLLGTDSADNARAMIESLIGRNEYIDANERRHNGFGASLAKFAQFADISVEGLKHPMDKKSCQPPVSSAPFVVKTVDFDNPHNCTYYKPCSFILNESKYDVGSWRELYTKFLILLYTDNTYSETMKGLVGKSLYGHKIDFADNTILSDLRRPIRVSTNFFAEGNLSAIEIIKRIKCLMELCSIAGDSMVIEYDMQEKNDESAELTETSANDYEQLSIPDISEKAVTSAIVSDMPEKAEIRKIEDSCESTPAVSVTEDEKLQVQVEPIPHEAPIIEDKPTIASFVPDTTKPFIFKDAVIEILSSDAPDITKYREYKNGISSKSLRELIKKYYGKFIGLFEISKLLMMDRTFKSVGRGCFILNESMISQKAEIDESVSAAAENPKEEPANSSYNAVSYTEQVDDTSEVTSGQVLTIEPILEVIKENSGKLQYEDGFGAYEVKTLLSGKGFKDVSEEQIDDLMSECSELQQVEDGYYSLIDNESYYDAASESIVVENMPDNTNTDSSEDMEEQEVQRNDYNRQIVLRLDGDIVRAYDYNL